MGLSKNLKVYIWLTLYLYLALFNHDGKPISFGVPRLVGDLAGWEMALGMVKGVGFLGVWGSQHYSPTTGL